MALITGHAVVYDERVGYWRVYGLQEGQIVAEYGASKVAQRPHRTYEQAMALLERVQAGRYGRGNRRPKAPGQGRWPFRPWVGRKPNASR
jgi:hypothetical protein